MKRKILITLCLFVLVSCATVGKSPTKIETITTTHFIVFETNPPGATVFVIDLLTGKESAMLGMTPVKIMVLKKQIEIYNNGERRLVNITPTFPGPVTIGKKIAEGVEFQFKFRLQGFYDSMVIERINLLSIESTDKLISTVLRKIER